MTQTDEYKTPPATREAVKNYAQRQRASGLIQIKLWVPPALADSFYHTAAQLRSMHAGNNIGKRRLYIEIREVAP